MQIPKAQRFECCEYNRKKKMNSFHSGCFCLSVCLSGLFYLLRLTCAFVFLICRSFMWIAEPCINCMMEEETLLVWLWLHLTCAIKTVSFSFPCKMFQRVVESGFRVFTNLWLFAWLGLKKNGERERERERNVKGKWMRLSFLRLTPCSTQRIKGRNQ